MSIGVSPVAVSLRLAWLLTAVVVLPVASCVRLGWDIDDATPEAAPIDLDAASDVLGNDLFVDTAPSACAATCYLGCNETAARCYRVTPSNVDPKQIEQQYSQMTAAVTGATSLSFNVDTGEVQNESGIIRSAGSEGSVAQGVYWGVVDQGSGFPQISVFGMASIDIPVGATASIVGQRALALYTTGRVEVAGTLIAEPSNQLAVAGGFDGGGNMQDGEPCNGGGEGKGGTNGNEADSGGGGGGRISSGGKGGDANFGVVQGPPGGLANGNASLIPLYGGCGGGGAGAPFGAKGGGGGGAVQVSANGDIVVTGVITMPGAGGEGDCYSGGAGGGSGGAILLEASTVNVTGTLAANGGGGGGGCSNHGAGGEASAANAAGGSATVDSGAGGQGGALSPQQGAAGQDEWDAGGGGGSAGRIRINTLNLSTNGIISPAPSKNGSIAKW